MPQEIAAFAQTYRQALLDVLDTLPRKSRAFVPPCIEHTSFVLAVADPRGRLAVEFRSRERYPTLKINGNEAQPKSDREPGLIAVASNTKLETLLFPGTTDSSSVTWRLSGHAALHGLTFASAEFMSQHAPQGFHAQFTGGDVPFEVQSDGGILAVNIANGYVVAGKPEVKFTEWARVFGARSFLPKPEAEIRELAITDLSSAALKLPNALPNWNFADFLASLEGPVDQNVLLLGSYATGDRFKEIAGALEKLGYSPFLLKDSPDLPIQRNLEKLFAAVMFSSFLIIVDDEASGHIAELATLLQFRFRPMILLRRASHGSTSFLEDGVLTEETCRVEVIAEVTAASLLPAVRWAREWLANREGRLNAINSWRQDT
ncbi:MAG: hypothetical protein GEV05_00375 [Betaproteobacteria bacterium]|nr:hypothetical protein [Betaproteobacteria bacterium]